MQSFYKIVHTTCHKQWGDTAKRIFTESVWMAEKGHKIIIVAPRDTPLFLKAKKKGFKVYGVTFKRFSILKEYLFLKKIFYNEKPDIINTHGSRDSRLALLAAHKARVPLRILSWQVTDPVRNALYNRRLYKKLCHYIFTTSDETTRQLQKTFKINNLRIFSMPDGSVEPDPFPDKITTKTPGSLKSGTDTKHHTIDAMGRDIIRIYYLHQMMRQKSSR